MKKEVKLAFEASLPVLVGYIFLGLAFGILLAEAGFNALMSWFMCIAIFSGSLQFLCISFLPGTVPVLEMIVLSALMNVRHTFYGLSMLGKYKGLKHKPYLIYSLSDETFSITSSYDVTGLDADCFYFHLSMFNKLYWTIGSIAGALIKSSLPFNTTGIDFAMTALFVVLFVENICDPTKRFSGFTGFFVSLACLLVIGKTYFIVASLLLITAVLLYKNKKEECK